MVAAPGQDPGRREAGSEGDEREWSDVGVDRAQGQEDASKEEAQDREAVLGHRYDEVLNPGLGMGLPDDRVGLLCEKACDMGSFVEEQGFGMA